MRIRERVSLWARRQGNFAELEQVVYAALCELWPAKQRRHRLQLVALPIVQEIRAAHGGELVISSISGNWTATIVIGDEYRPDYPGSKSSMLSPIPFFSNRRAGSMQEVRGPRDSASIALIDLVVSGPAPLSSSCRNETAAIIPN